MWCRQRRLLGDTLHMSTSGAAAWAAYRQAFFQVAVHGPRQDPSWSEERMYVEQGKEPAFHYLSPATVHVRRYVVGEFNKI